MNKLFKSLVIEYLLFSALVGWALIPAYNSHGDLVPIATSIILVITISCSVAYGEFLWIKKIIREIKEEVKNES